MENNRSDGENNRSDEKNQHNLLKPIRFIVIMAVLGGCLAFYLKK